jgi:hypothetical protein
MFMWVLSVVSIGGSNGSSSSSSNSSGSSSRPPVPLLRVASRSRKQGSSRNLLNNSGGPTTPTSNTTTPTHASIMQASLESVGSPRQYDGSIPQQQQPQQQQQQQQPFLRRSDSPLSPTRTLSGGNISFMSPDVPNGRISSPSTPMNNGGVSSGNITPHTPTSPGAGPLIGFQSTPPTPTTGSTTTTSATTMAASPASLNFGSPHHTRSHSHNQISTYTGATNSNSSSTSSGSSSMSPATLLRTLPTLVPRQRTPLLRPSQPTTPLALALAGSSGAPSPSGVRSPLTSAASSSSMASSPLLLSSPARGLLVSPGLPPLPPSASSIPMSPGSALPPLVPTSSPAGAGSGTPSSSPTTIGGAPGVSARVAAWLAAMNASAQPPPPLKHGSPLRTSMIGIGGSGSSPPLFALPPSSVTASSSTTSTVAPSITTSSPTTSPPQSSPSSPDPSAVATAAAAASSGGPPPMTRASSMPSSATPRKLSAFQMNLEQKLSGGKPPPFGVRTSSSPTLPVVAETTTATTTTATSSADNDDALPKAPENRNEDNGLSPILATFKRARMASSRNRGTPKSFTTSPTVTPSIQTSNPNTDITVVTPAPLIVVSPPQTSDASTTTSTISLATAPTISPTQQQLRPSSRGHSRTLSASANPTPMAIPHIPTTTLASTSISGSSGSGIKVTAHIRRRSRSSFNSTNSSLISVSLDTLPLEGDDDWDDFDEEEAISIDPSSSLLTAATQVHDTPTTSASTDNTTITTTASVSTRSISVSTTLSSSTETSSSPPPASMTITTSTTSELSSLPETTASSTATTGTDSVDTTPPSNSRSIVIASEDLSMGDLPMEDEDSIALSTFSPQGGTTSGGESGQSSQQSSPLPSPIPPTLEPLNVGTPLGHALPPFGMTIVTGTPGSNDGSIPPSLPSLSDCASHPHTLNLTISDSDGTLPMSSSGLYPRQPVFLPPSPSPGSHMFPHHYPTHASSSESPPRSPSPFLPPSPLSTVRDMMSLRPSMLLPPQQRLPHRSMDFDNQSVTSEDNDTHPNTSPTSATSGTFLLGVDLLPHSTSPPIATTGTTTSTPSLSSISPMTTGITLSSISLSAVADGTVAAIPPTPTHSTSGGAVAKSISLSSSLSLSSGTSGEDDNRRNVNNHLDSSSTIAVTVTSAEDPKQTSPFHSGRMLRPLIIPNDQTAPDRIAVATSVVSASGNANTNASPDASSMPMIRMVLLPPTPTGLPATVLNGHLQPPTSSNMMASIVPSPSSAGEARAAAAKANATPIPSLTPAAEAALIQHLMLLCTGTIFSRFAAEKQSDGEWKIENDDAFVFFSREMDPAIHGPRKDTGRVGAFYWCQPGMKKEIASQRIALSEVKCLHHGKKTDCFTLDPLFYLEPSQCISIVGSTPSQQLNLFGPSEEAMSQFLLAIAALLKATPNAIYNAALPEIPLPALPLGMSVDDQMLLDPSLVGGRPRTRSRSNSGRRRSAAPPPVSTMATSSPATQSASSSPPATSSPKDNSPGSTSRSKRRDKTQRWSKNQLGELRQDSPSDGTTTTTRREPSIDWSDLPPMVAESSGVELENMMNDESPSSSSGSESNTSNNSLSSNSRMATSYRYDRRRAGSGVTDDQQREDAAQKEASRLARELRDQREKDAERAISVTNANTGTRERRNTVDSLLDLVLGNAPLNTNTTTPNTNKVTASTTIISVSPPSPVTTHLRVPGPSSSPPPLPTVVESDTDTGETRSEQRQRLRLRRHRTRSATPNDVVSLRVTPRSNGSTDEYSDSSSSSSLALPTIAASPDGSLSSNGSGLLLPPAASPTTAASRRSSGGDSSDDDEMTLGHPAGLKLSFPLREDDSPSVGAAAGYNSGDERHPSGLSLSVTLDTPSNRGGGAHTPASAGVGTGASVAPAKPHVPEHGVLAPPAHHSHPHGHHHHHSHHHQLPLPLMGGSPPFQRPASVTLSQSAPPTTAYQLNHGDAIWRMLQHVRSTQPRIIGFGNVGTHDVTEATLRVLHGNIVQMEQEEELLEICDGLHGVIVAPGQGCDESLSRYTVAHTIEQNLPWVLSIAAIGPSMTQHRTQMVTSWAEMRPTVMYLTSEQLTTIAKQLVSQGDTLPIPSGPEFGESAPIEPPYSSPNSSIVTVLPSPTPLLSNETTVRRLDQASVLFAHTTGLHTESHQDHDGNDGSSNDSITVDGTAQVAQLIARISALSYLTNSHVMVEMTPEAKRTMDTSLNINDHAAGHHEEKDVISQQHRIPGVDLWEKYSLRLQEWMKIGGFGDAFLEHGGGSVLLIASQVAPESIAADALQLLMTLICSPFGMEYIKEQSHLIARMVDLVLHPHISVARNALALLFVLCELCEASFGFAHIHAALHRASFVHASQRLILSAVASTTTSTIQPALAGYGRIIALVDSSDSDTKVNALTLINAMVKKVPPDQLQSLVEQLENANLFNVLDEQHNISKDFATQLQLFRVHSPFACELINFWFVFSLL